MKATIKSTTTDVFSQAEKDATFDNGQVAVTLVLRDPKKALAGKSPKQVAQCIQDVLTASPRTDPLALTHLSIDIYAGPGEDVANVEED